MANIVWLMLAAACLHYTEVCTASLRCLECKDMTYPQLCKRMITCSALETCYVEQFVTSSGRILYNSGCMSKQICLGSNGRKRSLLSDISNMLNPISSNYTMKVPETTLERRSATDVVTCIHCCDGELCNANGCGTKAPMSCLECTRMPHPQTCQRLVTCSPLESCYVKQFINDDGQILYNSGCMSDGRCQSARRRSTYAEVKNIRKPRSVSYKQEASNETLGRLTRGDITTAYPCVIRCQSARRRSAYAKVKNIRKPRFVTYKQEASNETLGRLTREDITTCVECCRGDSCNDEGCGTRATHEQHTTKPTTPVPTTTPTTPMNCLECKSMPHPQTCQRVVTCSPLQSCYVKQFIDDNLQILYNSGCMPDGRCQSARRRSAYAKVKNIRKPRFVTYKQEASNETLGRLTREDITTCVECCRGDSCNDEGCGTKATHEQHTTKPTTPVPTTTPTPVWMLCFISLNGFNIEVEDTVTLQGYPDSDSHFGYSVGITGDNNSPNRWILVGAPRSEDPLLPQVPRPGVVFACTFPSKGSSTCTKLNIDENMDGETYTLEGKSYNYNPGRNYSWLGGSIEVKTSGSADVFATCAHRWTNEIDLGRNLLYMTGFCYEVPLDLNMANVRKIPVTTPEGRIYKRISGTNSYRWHFGLAGLGISVHYAKNGKNLLMGATGLMDWTGGFVDLSSGNTKIMDNKIGSTDITRPILGYSSSSGKYFSDGKAYFVFGAPRDVMQGSVTFFSSVEDTHVFQNALMSLKGMESGKDLPLNAYFGSTLCTMDVNNDGKDDLLIAAPMYSVIEDGIFTEGIDIGMVFVYLGSTTLMTFKPNPQILKGKQPYGRFGSAIASLGDINADSFADVAIGAPYEQESRGAVYIFNGYTDGVWAKYSQRIKAADIDTGLRGFGISISSKSDINSDDINDMVVGSYLSAKAVVMFGKPVIDVDSELNVVDKDSVATDFIELVEDKISSARTCFTYTDFRCSDITLSVTLSLDVGFSAQTRLKFAANSESTITNVLKLSSGQQKCTPLAEMQAKSTNDLITEINVQADYVADNINCPGLTVGATINQFDGANPTDTSLLLNKKLMFRNGCPNNYCKTDLTLIAGANYTNVDGFFVIGDRDLAIDVQILKEGDSAFDSVFNMDFPSYIGYKKVEKLFGERDISCLLADKTDNETNPLPKDEQETSRLSCVLGNILSNDTETRLKFSLNMPATFKDSSPMLHMYVTTISEDQDPQDNNQTIAINLRHNLEASYTVISSQEVVYLIENKQTYNLENIYELINRGPSVLPSAEINISFSQLQHSGKALLYLNTTEIKCEQNCGATCRFLQDYTTPIIYSYLNGRLVSQTEDPATSLSDIHNKDCRQEKCSIFTCTLTNIQPETGAVIYLNYVIDRDIEDNIKDGKSMVITSTTFVDINGTNLISNQTEFSAQLSTQIRRRALTNADVPWWLFVASGSGGLVLISLLVLALWKCGFFKRKKRDELEKRKSRIPASFNKMNLDKQNGGHTGSKSMILDNEAPLSSIGQ